jgi:hypothetical protein
LKEINLNSGSGAGRQKTPPSPGQEIDKNEKEKIKTSEKITYAQDLKQSEKTRSLPRMRD